MKTIGRLALVILVLAVVVIPVAAQGGDPGADQKQLTQELWCPICNGIRLDVCEQKVCEQMRDQIAIDLKAGKTSEQIKQEFIEFYGPSVLGEPPREGFSLLAWIVPVLLLVGGLAAIVVLTRRWTRKPAPTTAASTAPDTSQPEDPYLARVNRELSDK